ncbi:putative HAD-like domain, mitochondrial PGP phosphatase [Rosa chinensis]|uniref:Putative HAD-like domain, mitochondrial PGP phosphatase n=1 Tax=Rosa chinensis TaxID=74649 RepID=A0A2P6S075_ROSCH|nr:putative HAD-like domain, mitochondrial PGP phosphatase [Rosa chinensis]
MAAGIHESCRYGDHCSPRHRPGLRLKWAWAFALGPIYFSFYLCCFLLIGYGFMPPISPHYFLVGRNGRCLDMHTLCALSSLARRRTVCLIKWTQPPSGRMKLSVAGVISVRQHSGKTMLFVMMFLRYRVIFPVCHGYVKANGVAFRALFANWCLLEYIDLVENPGLKKPAGTAEEIEKHFGCKSSHLIMVGDRPLTDIVYGNQNGFLTILTGPLSLAEEPFIVRQVRKLETALVNSWSRKGLKPMSHRLLPDGMQCVKHPPPL